MSVLSRRIKTDTGYYPDLTEKGIYNTPPVTPLIRIGIYPGTVTYEDALVLVSSDGDPYYATGQGEWGQLYAAGSIS